MESRIVGRSVRQHGDAYLEHVVSGCAGKTDAQVKAFIGWVDESDFWKATFTDYERVDGDTVIYETIERYKG